MPGWASPARPAVYKPPAGAQVASPQSPILRRSRSRLSELHHQTRGADKSPLLIARLLLLSTNGLLLLTRLSPFARTTTHIILLGKDKHGYHVRAGGDRLRGQLDRGIGPNLVHHFARRQSVTERITQTL